MSQSNNQVQPLLAENVLNDDEVLLWEDPEVLGVISLPCAYTYAHQFHIY